MDMQPHKQQQAYEAKNTLTQRISHQNRDILNAYNLEPKSYVRCKNSTSQNETK